MITLQSIVKQYGATQVLSNISLTVEEGEFLALLGPNGAGKTTIIRILLDFTRPTAGSAFLQGIACSNPAARERVGYLPEQVKIPSFLTGRAYLKRTAELSLLTVRSSARAIEQVLETVDMRAAADNRCGTYSKGMLQRIGLAAALLTAPRILILDEPTTGLDPVGIRLFRQILERVKPDKVTLLLNSHILSEVEKLCTSAAIINNGELIVKDTIANLVGAGETLEDVFVRSVEKRAN